MHVETIQMDPRIARIHYKDYMAACRKHREERERRRAARASELAVEMNKVRVEKTLLEKEDEELLRAYRELCRGERILDLPKVIGAASYDEMTGMPCLAAVRADAESCWCNMNSDEVLFKAGKHSYSKADTVRIRYPEEWPALFEYSFRESNSWRKVYELKALVPVIPPTLRPEDPSKYVILWDAKWENEAPVDPILLKPISDRLYTVVAQWDLTPIERRVLEGRL